MGKRVEYLDLVKTFAIFFVLWGHSIQYLAKGYFYVNPVFSFIYSFHMPLFMVVSGYFFSSSLKLSFWNLIKKKGRQLILPVITWSLAMELILFSIDWMTGKKTGTIHVSGFFLSVSNSFWFLKSLFSCYIFAYAGLKLLKKEWIACVVTILIFILFPGIFQESFMLPFFWMGIFLNKYMDRIEQQADLILAASILLFASMLVFWKGEYTIYKNPWHNIFNVSDLTFRFVNCGIPAFRLLIGAVGSLAVMLGIRFIYLKGMTFSNFIWVGKNTLGIYLIQTYIFVLGLSKWNFPKMDSLIYNFIVTPLISIFIVVFSLTCIKVIEKSNFANFLLLGGDLRRDTGRRH